ncbi:MAG: hypothetical protein AB7S78_02565 [Candidatus Omnitrophota bacterium]
MRSPIFPVFRLLLLTILPMGGFLLNCNPVHAQESASLSERQKQVEAYLTEFAAAEFRAVYPRIYQALINALNKLPEEVFVDVTDRASPVIFINSITSGIARYANSKEFYFNDGDLPALQDGFYLVILGDELNNSEHVGAIEGVILHELAHDFLKHLRAPKHNCEMEREANRLVKSWGYAKEYEQASEAFGAKHPGDSPCADYFRKQEELKNQSQSQ